MSTNESEQLIYLTNLLICARADGKIASREEEFLGRVRKRIGASKSLEKRAEAVVESGAGEVRLLRRFSQNISNLEDMIAVSIIDGEFSEKEKALLVRFSELVGLSNEQLKAIFGQVREELIAEKRGSSCSACGAEVPSLAKFCPSCGKSTIDKDAKPLATEYEIPRQGIAIEFCESSAAGHAEAVRVARGAPTFLECSKSKKLWYLGCWPNDRMTEALPLVEALKGSRNRKVWIDGAENKWDDVFGFVSCFKQRAAAFRPAEYCFGIDERRLNIWGCVNTQLDWSHWARWFGYGKFRSVGLLKSGHVFVFDKERIAHELQVNVFRVRYCPHLNGKLLDAVLGEFPDEVEVSATGDWRYKEDYYESPGGISVKIKVMEDGYAYVKEFKSAGVEPRSPEIGIAILRRAFQRIGMGANVMKSLQSYRDR